MCVSVHMRVCGHLSCVYVRLCVRLCVVCLCVCVVICVYVLVCVRERACGHVRASVCHYDFVMLMCTIFILTIFVQFGMDIQSIMIWKL